MTSPTTMLDCLRYDATIALRGLRRRPLFTAMVAMIFALGIGANSTMFGVLDRLLLQAPEHISEPDRVVLFHVRNRGATWVQTSQPYAILAMLRREVGDFLDVAVATPTGVVRRTYYPVGSGATAARAAGALVSGNYFSVLGVHPALGRFFREDEENESDAPKLVVLGFAYWQREYAARRDVVGKTIEIGARPRSRTAVGRANT
jgi:putative ABC transport system permease protein